MQHSHTVVPAQPGFNTIEVVHSDASPPSYILSPVIAWLVEVVPVQGRNTPTTFVTPITVEDSPGSSAVVRPDGSVSGLDDQVWPSIAAWLSAYSEDIA